jgi:pyruvate dehydrogenase E1 component
MDAGQLAYYREDIKGQILEEGITEAGAMSSWIAAGTSYSVNGVAMIPFYIFYSMFGYQRIGDLCWAAGDMRTRGFLLGGTAGRTTLNGEGLQHEDGHSHLIAAAVPNCQPYDPTFAYELAVIIQDGLRRMVAEQQDVHYYITVMNENYQHPAMPAGVEDGIRRGMYLFKAAEKKNRLLHVQLLGSGTILREVIAAAELLKNDWDVSSDIWSCPSFTLLKRDGEDANRWNCLHPLETPREPYVTRLLQEREGPAIAATDYMRAFAEQIRPYVPMPYFVLGTDGFGRSDTREALRAFFEVDRHWITITALRALAEQGDVDRNAVAAAITKYGIDPEKPNPVTV